MTRRSSSYWKILSCLALALLVIAVLAGCGGDNAQTDQTGVTDQPPATGGTGTTGGSPATGEAQYGGVLKIVDVAEGAQPLGVPWETAGIDIKLMIPCVETLVREDAAGEISPYLASDWNVDLEKNTITFNLREGVKFHDGTPFNAQAVKFNFDYLMAAEQVTGWKSVDVIDDYTVSITLEQYGNAQMNSIASHTAGIISPTAFEKEGIEWARWNPVGTGPFKLDSYARNESIKYSKFDDYWMEGKPYLDGIEFLFIRDPMTQQAAMQSGGDQKIDVLAVTSADQATTMKSKGFEVILQPIGPVSLVPDSAHKDSPLSDIKVREAIEYAIDREAITKARGFDIWTPAYQFQPDNQVAHIPNFVGRKYDPEKARQLLQEAGHADGLKLTIYAMPGLVDRDAMVIVQRYLAKVGIDVKLEFPDAGAYNELRFGQWSNGFLAQHTRALANFNRTFSFYFRSETGQFPPLKRADGLEDMINKSLLQANPKPEVGQAMNQLIFDDVMLIPLYNVYEMYITQPYVHDTGYGEWGSGTVFTPETAWMSKQ